MKLERFLCHAARLVEALLCYDLIGVHLCVVGHRFRLPRTIARDDTPPAPYPYQRVRQEPACPPCPSVSSRRGTPPANARRCA